MTPQVSNFIPGSLDDMDKHIVNVDGHHVMKKETGQLQIKMCDDNGDTFITKLHNVLLAPFLCKWLFSNITLMNLGHTYLVHKGFLTVYFVPKEKNTVTLPHNAQRKHAFLGKIKEM